jgi:hypothetical protein
MEICNCLECVELGHNTHDDALNDETQEAE